MKRKMSMSLAMVLAVSMIFSMQPVTSKASSDSLMEEKETEFFTENETVIEDEEEVPKAENIEEKTTQEETTEEELTEEETTEEETTEEETTEEETTEEATQETYKKKMQRTNAASVFEQGDFLRANGKNLENLDGELINLRGTNAGGFLLQEFWMTPTASSSNVKAEYDIYRYLQDKYGAEGLYDLIDCYQNSYWTEADFDRCAELGMNVIRLPFWYRNLVDENGTFYGYDEEAEDPYQEAFELFDWFISQANARGIYVILDFHGAPGSQNGSDHSGVDGGNHKEDASEFFFGNNAQKNQELFYHIWEVIADRYAGNPGVAGYDLLNEPYCTYRYNAKLNSEELHDLLWNIYDKAYDRIRKVNNKHCIIMEATWNPVDLPNPVVYGWNNVMYEYHNYLYDDYDNAAGSQITNMESKLNAIALADYNVPSYMGEFSYFNNLDAWDEGLALLNDAGINWTTWTYKTIEDYGNWGLYHHTKEFNNGIDLETAEYEEIEEWYSRMDEIEANTGLCEIASKYFKAKVQENTMLPTYVSLEDGSYYLTTAETECMVMEDTQGRITATSVQKPEDAKLFMWEITSYDDKTVSLKNVKTGKYLSVHAQDKGLYADADSVTDSEKFYLLKMNQTQSALKSKSEELYVTAHEKNGYVLEASALQAEGTESFYIYNSSDEKLGADALAIHSGWTRYEAEDADFIGANIRKDEQDFYSKGYGVTGLNNDMSDVATKEDFAALKALDFTVEVPQAGEYEFVITYNGDDDKKIAYQINEEEPVVLDVKRQAGGQWNALLENYFKADLQAGVNHIKVSGVLKNTGWINYDCLDICDTPIKEINGNVRYEGEDYYHTGKVEKQSFYSGSAGVGELNSVTALTKVLPSWSNVKYVEFTIYAQEAMDCTIRWGYNGNGADNMHAIYQVNDEEMQVLTLNNKGASWNKMNSIDFGVHLNKGFNKLKLSGTLEDKSNWANIDYIELVSADAIESMSGYTAYSVKNATMENGEAAFSIKKLKKGDYFLHACYQDDDTSYSTMETVGLQEGMNTVKVPAVKDGAALAYIEISNHERKLIDAQKQVIRYEAEDFDFKSTKSASEAIEAQDFYSGGYGIGGVGGVVSMKEGADIKQSDASWIAYTVYADKEASYEFKVAMNGNGADILAAYQIDEADSHFFTLPNAGKAWNEISFGKFEAHLQKGFHTVIISGGLSDTWADWVNYDYLDVTCIGETQDKLDEGDTDKPDKGNSDKPNNSEQESDNSHEDEKENQVSDTDSVIRIPETMGQVPLADISAINGLEYVNLTFIPENAKLKTELLHKYYGKNLYLMAHLGNGIGFSIATVSLDEALTELDLSTKMEQMDDFADGFTAYHVIPLHSGKLPFLIGVHMNVGKEYSGKAAYLFKLNMLTGVYELSSVTHVNEIGNVALHVNEMTDIMILIEK